MGQTLTHGIYLPEEGERNCYNGLASNWSILDGAVGTVAEHTTALSGKASLVHTHTKSQITDFPAYGTAAGTICEGNDSRLSDARTPVAHTHTKSDVTDLFNSANTWSANNTFSAGLLTGLIETNPGNTGLLLRSTDQTWENGARIFIYSNTHTGQTHGSIYVDVDHGDGLNNKTGLLLVPGAFYSLGGINGISLGTSTNKWKSLNGVNPGALSLPVRGYTDSISLDTTNWNYAGNGFSIPMTDNNGNYIPGWVVIVAEDVGDAFDYIKVRTTSYTRSPGLDFATFYTGSQYNIKACFPIDSIMYLVLKLTNGASCIKYARYYPCLGNV